MKLWRGTYLLFALAILALAPITTWGYEPRSDEELTDWWAGLTRDERLEQLRWIDQVDNTDPEITGPEHIIIQTDDGTITSYFDGPLVIDVAGRLHYEISLPPADAQAPRCPSVWRPAAIAAAAALLVGFFAGAAVF